MRNEDKTALEICSFLRNKYHELSKISGPYSNLIGIFFHELMLYYTNYILIKNSKYHYSHQISFPYLNTEYVRNPHPIKFDFERNKSTDLKTKAIIVFIKFRNLIQSLFGTKKGVAVLHPELFPVRLVLSLPLRFRIDIVSNYQCYIADYDLQFAFLRNTMLELSEMLDIQNSATFVENFIQYIQPYLTKQIPTIKSAFLLVGSNAVLVNRVNSANFLYQKKKVITFAHGDSCSSQLDDPYMGYGEFSYSTDYISYGKCFLALGEHNKPLHEMPSVHLRTSELINRIFKRGPIEVKSDKPSTKAIYLPTGLSENQRYGPFRDLDDNVYLKWQNAICQSGLDIYYKSRPQSKIYVDIDEDKILTDDLKLNESYYSDYDVYILDFFSTASTIVSATDKPIIYFNLGLMNIKDEALDDFKKRVFWYDIDLERSFELQISNAFEKFFKSSHDYVNVYTEKYCINKHGLSDLQLVKKIIASN